MKKNLKILTATTALAISIGVLGQNAFASESPLNHAKSNLKRVDVSNHEVQYVVDDKKIIDIDQTASGKYVVKNNRNDSFNVSVTPAVSNGIDGFNVSISDESGKEIMHTFSKDDIFNLKQSHVSKVITAPEAAIILIVTGHWTSATGAVLGVIGKIEQLGWYGVVTELYAEGYSVWEIAGLVISAIPDLGVIGIASVL